MLKLIVEGKLDYAEGQYLIREQGKRNTRHLGYYIGAFIGKRILVFAEEPEEKLVLNHSLKELLVEA